ncbi:MAG: calcium-binding protein, partial [Phycicoccus sp.]|nr:calcium-binding protein [Phycicoccus sp.]
GAVGPTPTFGREFDGAPLGANDHPLRGGGADGLIFVDVRFAEDRADGSGTAFYAYTFATPATQLTAGTLTVTFNAGAWEDTAGNLAAGGTQSIRVIEQGTSFFIEISGGIMLQAGDFLPEPLLHITAEVILEIDFARTAFILTFQGQISVYGLGAIGATAGRFVLVIGDENTNPMYPVPQLWGVASIETNFEELEQYGLFISGSAQLRINLTNEVKTETLTLKGVGPGGTDLTETFVLQPFSFGFQILGQLIVAPGGTELMRIQGGVYLNISMNPPTPSMDIFLTGTMSFGSGSARLEYGSVTGVLMISTRIGNGEIPGVAGSIRVSSGVGIGLPNIGSLFSATGSVNIIFNTTLVDQTFVVPNAFIPLLLPGQSPVFLIPKSPPGIDGQPDPNAPAGGSIYIVASIQAELTIGGAFTLTGFIGITAAIDPTGTAYLKVDGMVGTTIPYLGSLTGALNLAVYVGVQTGVVGRVQLTLGMNSIPGLSLNGQFLLEINTFNSVRQIRSFVVDTQIVNGNPVFGGFQRQNGQLVVANQTIGVVAGFRLEMYGSLRVMDVLDINGHLVLTIGASELSLIVNGAAILAPFGNVTIRDSGFRINSQGLVARLDLSLDAGFGGSIGLGFSVSAVLAINSTGATATFGSTPVAPGFLLRLDGSINFVGFARGSGFAEIRIASGAFEMSFGIDFDLAGLKFRASGVAGVYSNGISNGIVMAVSVSVSADAFVFSLSASGTLRLNTTGVTRMGIDPGFKLQLTGSVTLLKLFSFNAGFTIEVGKTSAEDTTYSAGDWYLDAYATLSFFGFNLSGKVFLSSDGSFSLTLSGHMQLGTSFMGIRGSFSLNVSFLKIQDDWGITYYTLFIGGSASVEVYFDFKIFEISLGVGLALSVTADSRQAAPNGDVPLKFNVTVRFKILGSWYSRSASITLGTVRFPVVPYLASNNTNYEDYRTYRAWTAGDTNLYLTVGCSGDLQLARRNVAMGQEDETVYIEQLGNLEANGRATIKVTAFGYSGTYEHVANVYGYFGDGVDRFTVDPNVQIPVFFYGGAGNDTADLKGSGNGSVLSGGDGDDRLTVSGTATATVNGGANDDTLTHTGTGTVTLNGDGGNDQLFGNLITDVLNGGDGNDTLSGLAQQYDGGAGDDVIAATAAVFTSAVTQVVIGGTGTDKLTLVLGGGADQLTITNPSTGVLSHTLGALTKTTSGIEHLVIDAGAGPDQLTLDDVTGNGSGLTLVEVSLGTGDTDIVRVLGSAAGVDTFAISTDGSAGTRTKVLRSTAAAYTVLIAGGVRAQGDALVVDGRGGADSISAAAVTADQLALTLIGGTEDDTLVGSPFNDILDSGSGNDTVTGGLGRDTFLDSGGSDTLVESFTTGDFGLYNNLFVVGLAVGTDFGVGSVAEDLKGIFEIARLTAGPAATTILVGDFDGTVTVAGAARTASPWTGNATINPGGGNDLIRVELTRSTGLVVHVADSTGTDTLAIWGSTAPDDLIVDMDGANGRTRRVSFADTGFMATLGTITHVGVEFVEIGTLTGGDRIAVRAIQVEHRISTGEHTDRIAVGSNAAGSGTTNTTWTNTGGNVNAISALLVVDGGSGPGALTGADLLAVDDTGDLAANTGELTTNRLTGLGMSAGITYPGFELLTIDLGSGGDTFTVHSTITGTTALTTNNGADLVIVRSVAGITSIDTGAGDDTVRLSSTLTGVGGDLVGIRAPLSITGGTGTNDRLFLDDAATILDRIGVVTGTSVSGLGMTGGSPKPSLVQVVSVLGAVDGRFTLTVAGVGTTGHLAFDATAAQVQAALAALVVAANVVVTKAGGRWVVVWTGALAGAAGWTRTITVAAVAGYPLVAGSGTVTTGVLPMTDGRIDYFAFEALDLTLGSGSDVLNVDSTQTGTTAVHAALGDDRVFVEALSGTTTIEGQGGDDWLVVNAVPGPEGVNPMNGQVLNLDGGANSDYFLIDLFGVGTSRINTLDIIDGGTNVLVLNGSALSDTFLLRRNTTRALIALLSAQNEITGLFGTAEKVTYGTEMTGGVVVNGLGGDDTFAFDDTASTLVVNGNSGNDTFRFGQLYTSYVADPEFGVPATDFFASTRGLLTRGVSFSAAVYGGTGDDVFEVFRNVATLNLYGDAGDDTFVIRSFVGESELTALDAGEGRNFIEYAANAPVNIDGGSGYDLVVIIGTEFNDTFVITANGVYGAGRVVRYINVEKVSIYGMEGDDVFHVLSTNPAVELSIFGGLGSDRVEVGSAAPAVQANDLLGHTGLIRHSVESAVENSAWALLPVDGIATEIMDNDEPTVVVAPAGGSLVLTEGGAAGSVTVRLTRAPLVTVQVTLVGPAIDPTSTSRARAIELSIDGGTTWQTSVTLVFAVGATDQRTVLVRAIDDLAAEGEWFSPIDAIVTGGEYAGALVATTFVRVLDDDVPEVAVVEPDGGVRVVEPAGGTGGTTATYQVRLTETPRGPVTVLVTAPTGLRISLDGTTWVTSLVLTFAAAGAQTVNVRAVDDTVVEGQHAQAIPAVVTSVDRILGIVGGPGGLPSEFQFASGSAPGALKGHLIRITTGAGAGQVRRIWNNTADMIEIEGEWDIAPTTGDAFVITGYTAPIVETELVGTVSAISGDYRTVTLTGVTLPTVNGGLVGALLRFVGANGTATYRTIAANTATTVTVTEAWGATTFTPGTSQVYVAEVAGVVVPRVDVLVFDGDTPGVVVSPVGGDIRLVEGANTGQFGATATYTVRLTTAPAADETVTVRLNAIASSTLDIGGPNCGLPNGCSEVQLEFWNGSAWVGQLALTFTTADWMTARTVTIRALDDTRIDGGDVQEFADAARRLHLIQGPLYVSGGDDPNPPVQLQLDGYLPIVLPGESSGHPTPITASTADAIESAQVDTLVVHNEDSPANDSGVLTSTRLTGLGMAADYSLAGRPVLGGIRYVEFEDLTILLGYGDDTFTVVTTHAGTTTIDAGLGDDVVTIRTIDGHTRVIGGPAALALGRTDDDTFHVGTAAGLLDLLAALLVLEGGVGDDVANLYDFGNTNDNLGWLTQDTLTGLDMTPRTGLDDLGRPLDQLYSVTPKGGATQFTIVLSQRQLVGGVWVPVGIGAVTFAVGAAAEVIQLALQLLLFPQSPSPAATGVSMRCGAVDDSRCAASVYVWQVGGTYLIGFRGEVNESTTRPITIQLAALGTDAVAVATDASSRAGIRYDGLETLNLSLGSGSDVLNIRGTLPVTNVSFGAGDDRVYISSRADVGLSAEPEFLAGDLDLIAGTLNLDLGSGRHILLLSDEGAGAGDGSTAQPVLITDDASNDQPTDARSRDANLSANGEIFVAGLAPAGISWRANAVSDPAGVGTFADGIRIWTSGFADTITIDGTHRRPGVRTTTWLNTGLGNDHLTVNLTAGQDGFFVLNTQGPNDNLLGLNADLGDGDEPVVPDVVDAIVVTRGGTSRTIDPAQYVVSSRLDTVGLFDSLLPGDVVTVTLHLTTWTVQSGGTFNLGSLADVVGYRVWVNGRLLLPGEITLVGTQLSFTTPLQRGGAAAHVVVEVTRTATETFTMPATGGILPAGTTDDDVVHAEPSTLPLVVFGGIGADEIHGGTGGDIVFGDRGLVQWVNPATGAVVAQSGNGGVDDFTDGVVRPLGLVTTVDPSIGGDDVITTGG